MCTESIKEKSHTFYTLVLRQVVSFVLVSACINIMAKRTMCKRYGFLRTVLLRMPVFWDDMSTGEYVLTFLRTVPPSSSWLSSPRRLLDDEDKGAI
jgi:hypothetical protein